MEPSKKEDLINLPQIQLFIFGIKPAIIAIILAAIHPLARKSLKTIELGILGIVVLIFCFIGINEIYVMFGSGFIALALNAIRLRKANSLNSIFPFILLQVTNPHLFNIKNLSLFLTFLKIGAMLYGCGYVLSISYSGMPEQLPQLKLLVVV